MALGTEKQHIPFSLNSSFVSKDQKTNGASFT